MNGTDLKDIYDKIETINQEITNIRIDIAKVSVQTANTRWVLVAVIGIVTAIVQLGINVISG